MTQHFSPADFPSLSQTGTATEEDDYQLALRLQREFDEQDARHNPQPEIHKSDEAALNESAHEQYDDEESLEPNSVQGYQAALDADYALALSLQAQFNDMTVNHRRTSYRSEPNEKVSMYSGPRGYGGEDFYADDGASESESDNYDSDSEEEEIERYKQEAQFDQLNNPPAVSYTGSPSKPHHQSGKESRKPAKIFTKHDPTIAAIKNAQKLGKYVESGDLYGLRVGNMAFNALRKDTSKHQVEVLRKRANVKDKAATESVLDNPTRMSLYKMLNSGLLEELNGVVSCGKEAHVYHGVGGHHPDIREIKKGEEYAVKIFNMDMGHTKFKDRAKYIDGEFRYRHTPTSNSRKAIKFWAEKELRNLKRLDACGIMCPRPILLRRNILIMSFIGINGVPAPRLKDAQLSCKQTHKVYMQCITMMRKLYQECGLVHADLSEYNILYYKKNLYFIDVSQAIECDHENAFTFLRRDAEVITKFFERNGVQDTMSTQELFNFITDKSINDNNIDAYIQRIRKQAHNRQLTEPSYEEQVQSEVFKQMRIPRSLGDVKNPAGEIDSVKNQGSRLVHGAVTGMRSDLTGTNTVPEILAQQQ